jgi:hypothetical protein
MEYKRALMISIFHDRIKIAKAVSLGESLDALVSGGSAMLSSS